MKTTISNNLSAAGSVAAILPHNDFITAPQFVAPKPPILSSTPSATADRNQSVGRSEPPEVQPPTMAVPPIPHESNAATVVASSAGVGPSVLPSRSTKPSAPNPATSASVAQVHPRRKNGMTASSAASPSPTSRSDVGTVAVAFVTVVADDEARPGAVAFADVTTTDPGSGSDPHAERPRGREAESDADSGHHDHAHQRSHQLTVSTSDNAMADATSSSVSARGRPITLVTLPCTWRTSAPPAPWIA